MEIGGFSQANKLWEIPVVIIQKGNSEGHYNVQRIKQTINPHHLTITAPATIPSDLSGPSGEPMGKPGTQAMLGQLGIIVEIPYKEFNAEWEKRI